MEYGVLVHKPGDGLYVSPDVTEHYGLMDEIKIPTKDYDNWTRLSIEGGEVLANYQWAGTLRGEEEAERRVGIAAKAMIASGYSPDTPMSWRIRRGVSIDIRLGDA